MQPIFATNYAANYATNAFDSSVGRVMRFTASGHTSLLIEVRGKCKYMH